MGFNSVYRSLVEIFPQVDTRILRAVAIEHPKDADEAVGVVLSEIVPCLPSNLACNFTRPQNKTSRSTSDIEAEHEMKNGEMKRDCAHMMSASNSGAYPLGTIHVVVDSGVNTSSASTESVSHLNKDNQMDKDLSDQKQAIVLHQCAKCSPVPYEAKTPIQLGESLVNRAKFVTTVDPARFLSQENIQLIGNGRREFVDGHRAGKFRGVDNRTWNQAESSSSTGSQNAVHNQVDINPGEDATNAQQGSGSSNVAHETSNGSVSSENGDVEFGGAFCAMVKRSSEGCSIDHLEKIIEDAKSNKKTLFAVMESVMNLMREVEVQEKDAEKAKEESDWGGVDTLNKVEELKKMLEHAREANDMHAGEVYGEKSILATEVKELESRLLNLSEERDKSLAFLDEMREMLEARLAAALDMKKAAEQEKHEKEDHARKALAELEVIMEKVVQESKFLQQEAEQNSKLREFLMDRGRIVDSLQGEISVICQDVRLLKAKFDERVPFSQSISSSQTSCRLASSASSMVNVLDKSTEQFIEKPMIPNVNQNPSSASLNEERDGDKELLEEGWDIC